VDLGGGAPQNGVNANMGSTEEGGYAGGNQGENRKDGGGVRNRGPKIKAERAAYQHRAREVKEG